VLDPRGHDQKRYEIRRKNPFSLRKINLGQKKNIYIFSPQRRLDSNSLTPKKHNIGLPRAMPPRVRTRLPPAPAIPHPPVSGLPVPNYIPF